MTRKKLHKKLSVQKVGYRGSTAFNKRAGTKSMLQKIWEPNIKM